MKKGLSSRARWEAFPTPFPQQFPQLIFSTALVETPSAISYIRLQCVPPLHQVGGPERQPDPLPPTRYQSTVCFRRRAPTAALVKGPVISPLPPSSITAPGSAASITTVPFTDTVNAPPMAYILKEFHAAASRDISPDAMVLYTVVNNAGEYSTAVPLTSFTVHPAPCVFFSTDTA